MTASNKTLIHLLTAAAVTLGALGSVQAQPAPAAANPATAQAAAHATHDARRHKGHPHSPEQAAEHAKKRAEKHAERQAAFLKKLNLSAAQQAAWTHYQAALHPAAGQAKPKASPDERKAAREAWGKLTTPQRIQAREQQHAQRHAAQQARDQATLAFYAQLSPAQQHVFDAEGAHGHAGHSKKPHGGKGHRH